MFEILSTLLKYIFITIIYLFILGIMRMIYLDIRSMGLSGRYGGTGMPYLKLVNLKDSLDFKVEEGYVLGGNEILLGRKSRNGISIRDPFLSGKHARLVYADGSYTIEDLGSTNGTMINGRDIGTEPRMLKNGDRLHIGQLDFLYVDAPRGGETESEAEDH